jgi:hypothetical protein
MIAPSTLPSGNHLRDQCVRLLLSDPLSEKFLKKMMRHPAYQALLPESVLQDIGSFASDNLDRLMTSLLSVVKPNLVHKHLALNYAELFTTNFDLCLEACGAFRVSHLHGAISKPDSLQNRIFRLGHTARTEVVRFKSQISGNGLLVLGYSMRDLDIIEAINTAAPSAILYLSYDGDLPPFLKHTPIPVSYAKGTAEELFSLPRAPRPTKRSRSGVIGRSRRPAIERRVPPLLICCMIPAFTQK